MDPIIDEPDDFVEPEEIELSDNRVRKIISVLVVGTIMGILLAIIILIVVKFPELKAVIRLRRIVSKGTFPHLFHMTF